ncbi:flavodoxin domain-containing protein [Kitasatospora paranensis]|uniref:Flavodoxin domain-containing protein n=1 Tax=Kitasatospora paranensis TaxID=258053 RepID=A0ABW2FP11_9ACTN
MEVLIGYAGAHGSTRGVAEHIAAVLSRRFGHRVTLVPLGPDIVVDGYDAAVLGSAVHDGRWLPAAEEFLRRSTVPLGRHPVWLFSVGLLGDRGSAFGPRTARLLRRLRDARAADRPAGARALEVRGHRNFAGAVARGHWPPAGRLVFRAMGGRYGDHRNWADVTAWAERIAASLAEQSGDRSA